METDTSYKTRNLFREKKMFLVIQKLLTKLIKIFISHNHSDRIDRRTTPVNNAVLFFECLQEGHVLRDHCHSDGASWAQMLQPPQFRQQPNTSHHSDARQWKKLSVDKNRNNNKTKVRKIRRAYNCRRNRCY